MVYLRCDVDGIIDLSYSWKRNNLGLNKESNKEYNFSANVKEDKLEYTCTARNPVHNNTSDRVKIECKYFLYTSILGLRYFLISWFDYTMICEYAIQSY